MGEFSLIEKYFSFHSLQRNRGYTALGIGDDAAILNVPPGQQLVVTMDTLVADVHFPLDTDPQQIAYKSLAVNVSDLVAMAATPAYFLLSITMPEEDEYFLEAFSQGLFEAADEFDIPLVGGDTCKGPLSITIQASGFIPLNRYVTRCGARIGDRIFVSGVLGAAALGLEAVQNRVDLPIQQEQFCLIALNKPQPRLDLINLLRKYATAAIDLSDGLIGDLGHILDNSKVGAVIDRQKIPAYEALNELNCFDYALTGGDDYQILFTVAENEIGDLMHSADQQKLELFEIGEIVKSGYLMVDQDKSTDLSTYRGFDHFVT